MGLCKWSTDDNCFYEPVWRAIYKGLCEWVKDPLCACKVRDSDAAIYEDCDGQLSTVLSAWQGQIGQIVSSTPIDDFVAAAGQALRQMAATVADTEGDPWAGV
jgi:hypothetical protein